VDSAWAQSYTFGGNAQHTANFPTAAQDLSAIRWTTSVDLNNTGGFAHYGAPLISPLNTVFVPVKTATDGFQVNVFSGNNGATKYTLTTDYILPSHSWIPTYNPTLATGAFGTRLYYAGAGGTVYYIDNPDSVSHGAPVQLVFYTTLANYQSNAANFNSTVFINTPLTPDANGNIYFGFRVQGTAPSPLNTTQSGFARISASGAGTFVLAGAAATDVNIFRDSHSSAPALSNDGSTLYVVVKSAASTEDYGYLLGLDSTTLATKYKVFLKDPRNGKVNNARILDNGTASPTVAPDGDVYMGVFANPSNGSRGFLLRFAGDLTAEKTPGGFGWDYTPAIVPASMAPSYTGASPYLIFSKYNNYPFSDGDGVNKIALLDPNATQIDPHTSANGLVEMREVLTITGPTPDNAPNFPNAVREWCINTAAVNPATNSIFTPSEDGHIYRWNLVTNSLSQAAALTRGIGEPYVPTVIGPDGMVYTLNGGALFAVGALKGNNIIVTSSKPDARTVVAGQSLTFSATVANTGGTSNTPTGNVTFSDLSYQGLTPVTTTLASMALDAGGHAAYSTAALSAGNHFITVTYIGDGTFSPGSATLVQQIHASASNTALSSSGSPSTPGQAVTFTATVTSAPPGGGTPTGMATFQEGVNVLAQIPLNSGGVAAFSTSALSAGSHTITAVYYSDGTFATSSGNVVQLVQASNANSSTSLTSSSNPSVSGQAVTFTATVTVSSGTPTGSVTFKDGATTLGTGNLNAQARATLTTSALSVGPHSITAVYAGDGAFAGSTSTPLAQQVSKDSSTTILTSSLNPSTRGQVVTFDATVTANGPGSGIPSGSITFKDKNKIIGSANLNATGRASLSISTLAQGAHQITAMYAGNANFITSTSATVNQTVKK